MLLPSISDCITSSDCDNLTQVTVCSGHLVKKQYNVIWVSGGALSGHIPSHFPGCDYKICSKRCVTNCIRIWKCRIWKLLAFTMQEGWIKNQFSGCFHPVASINSQVLWPFYPIVARVSPSSLKKKFSKWHFSLKLCPYVLLLPARLWSPPNSILLKFLQLINVDWWVNQQSVCPLTTTIFFLMYDRGQKPKLVFRYYSHYKALQFHESIVEHYLLLPPSLSLLYD